MFCISPSQTNPTMPHIKSLQWWQKVGLVRVTFRKQCPGALTEYRVFEAGDCWAFFLPVLGLELGLSCFSRPPSAISFNVIPSRNPAQNEAPPWDSRVDERDLAAAPANVMLNRAESSLNTVNVSPQPLCINKNRKPAVCVQRTATFNASIKARVSFCQR